jgi:hypothetical protein
MTHPGAKDDREPQISLTFYPAHSFHLKGHNSTEQKLCSFVLIAVIAIILDSPCFLISPAISGLFQQAGPILQGINQASFASIFPFLTSSHNWSGR